MVAPAFGRVTSQPLGDPYVQGCNRLQQGMARNYAHLKLDIQSQLSNKLFEVGGTSACWSNLAMASCFEALVPPGQCATKAPLSADTWSNPDPESTILCHTAGRSACRLIRQRSTTSIPPLKFLLAYLGANQASGLQRPEQEGHMSMR